MSATRQKVQKRDQIIYLLITVVDRPPVLLHSVQEWWLCGAFSIMCSDWRWCNTCRPRRWLPHITPV